jgi:peptidoglycan hydrolase-like protein with peptidoglycan-binding domain
METLAYLHLALAHETSPDVGLSERRDWRKFSSQAWMYLLPIIVALGVLGTASQTLAQTIRQGNKGPQVTFIQERLRQLGYFNQSPNGNFGSVTRNAVIRFQQDRGLPTDGIVGPQTETALFDEFDRKRRISTQPFTSLGSTNLVLRPGDRSPDVRFLQERLRDEGLYVGPIDGFFDSETEAAVRQFQRQRRLGVDGIVGSSTLAELNRGNRDIAERPRDRREVTLGPGSFGSQVAELQKRLKVAGFYKGAIDGEYGFGTTQAVRQLQTENNLAVTGIANRETLVALVTYRYVVIVPNESGDKLSQVRRSGFFEAFLTNSRLGDYVNVGVFNNRARAESRSQLLRSRGLDARVAYFP